MVWRNCTVFFLNGRSAMLERLFCFLALCVLCGAAQAVTVLDDARQKIEITRAPQRIVSLLPSLTETVCALGQCQRLVGVDRYSNWPESIKTLPRMGGGIDPNLESIVALRPDLVLAAGSTRGIGLALAQGLAESGATVILNSRQQSAVDAAVAQLQAQLNA